MSEPVRCGVSFENVEEFRAAFTARNPGVCFVAYPDELEPGRALVVDVDIALRVRLELEGVALDPDFDERGNTGVLVQLSEASAALVQKMDVDLKPGPLPEIFATTRLHKPPTARIRANSLTVEDAPTEALLEPGSMVDERFRIEAHLASGGMGEVYRANHVHLKRPVALKLLKRVFAADAEMWARFQREAELVSKLESPHVVRVFDFGRTHDGQPYLAMEYVEGTTLDVALEEGALSPERATRFLIQICDGLAEAHALGVIHRDLKPGNLIIGHRRDGSELVKILDFGIARIGDAPGRTDKQKLTQTGFVVGTPAYIAPEQALGDDVDGRADIYALGCVAYELLTGQPPFRAPELAKVISMQLTATPAPLESVKADLAQHPALCAAILRALSKEREKRFATVQEFIKALEGPLETPSTEGQPISPDEWPPPAPSAPIPVVTGTVVAEVDDFFSSSPSVVPPSAPRPAPAPQRAESGERPLERRLADARSLVPHGVNRAAFLFVEVVGVPPDSPASQRCLERALTVAENFEAFGEASDEDGVLLGFAAASQVPSGRAILAALAMKDAVVDEGTQVGQLSARLRAALVVDDFHQDRSRTLQVLPRARGLAAKAQGGQLVCERGLASEVGGVAEVSPLHEVSVVGPRRALRRAPAELVGRSAAIELVERRFAGLLQGVVAPLVLRGPTASGRTALALELAQRARKRSLVVVQVSATPSWSRQPGSLVAALVCAALGVPVEARARTLPAALEALKLPAPMKEAVLVVCGVVQPTWAFTAGQAAHALRAVLRTGAQDRSVVLLIDGLEHADEPGLEVFAELVTRPGARELTIGLASPGLAHERLAGATVVDLPALNAAELAQLVTGCVGVPPGPALAELLLERSRGLPALALEWLGWLDERGSLRVTNVAELADDVPSFDDAQLPRRRLALISVDVAHVLEAARCQGETFEASSVMMAFPRATQALVAQAAASRFMPVAGRRWAFVRHSDAEAVAARPSVEHQAMHQRLALAQVEAGRANPHSVDPLYVGLHFVKSGDAMRAVALLQHAAEVALARHAPRETALALKGMADALTPGGEPVVPRRVEMLARAASLMSSVGDPAGARSLLDEALALVSATSTESPELWLVQARVSRSEARRARAAEALSRVEAARVPTLSSLVAVERGEAFEAEGDLVKAMVAFEEALVTADAARGLARWHGEIDLVARVEARVGALCLRQKDAATARRLFESSATRWRAAQYPSGEARALSNLAATCASSKDMAAAVLFFGLAAEAAGRSGDFLFQAKALLQLAKAQKKVDAVANARAAATEARRLAVALGWEQGRLEATAMLE